MTVTFHREDASGGRFSSAVHNVMGRSTSSNGACLAAIFADHSPASYVALVREVRPLSEGVALLRAEVGMVPLGADDIAPGANAVQSLVATRDPATPGGWTVAHFTNTPAAFHGRPDAAEALTDELRRARSRD